MWFWDFGRGSHLRKLHVIITKITSFSLVFPKVKESSRGVKTAYKDLKSKLRDINPNQSSNFHSHISNSHHSGMDTMSQTSTSGDFSAPSSPINSKRQPFLQSSPISVNSSATDDALSSHVHLHPNGYSKGSLSQTVSPASSFGSLNFNLTQELQDHPLFKTPKVDRSVSNVLAVLELQISLNVYDFVALILYFFFNFLLVFLFFFLQRELCCCSSFSITSSGFRCLE